MLKGRRRWLALGVVGAVLVVGAGAGIAATGATDDGFLAGVAKRLGITEDKLQDAIRDEQIARIDQAVRDGDLSEEQAERLKDKVRSGAGLGPFGRGFDRLPVPDLGFGFGPGFGHALKGAGNQLDAAAEYLGLTQAQLREELSDGDSLADVAREKNKSVDGLKSAMRNALEADLDEAVDDGVITREQADNLNEKLSAAIDDIVERGLRFPKGFGRGVGFGFGGGELLEAAAGYLGLTERQLRNELSDGDSLADVAREKNKSVDGLKTALGNAVQADLDEAVEDGDLTRERADDLQEKLSEHVDAMVEKPFRGFGFRMRFGGPDGERDFRFGGAKLPDILPVPVPDEAIVDEVEASVF
jgi:polyhydroxyalkanoate synthesis regulator phasin